MSGRDLMQGVQIRLPVERHGSDYGGWNIVAGSLNADSIVYAFGVGTDISFDLSLIDRYKLTVHAYDPTPRSMAWVEQQSVPPGFVFHPVGVANFDGEASFDAPADESHVSFTMKSGAAGQVSAPVRKLTTLMAELGHDHIDLVKMDIEGAEYDVIDDMLDQSLDIRQFLVEFHHRMSGKHLERTRHAIARLNAAGYKVFAVAATGEEFSFIRA